MFSRITALPLLAKVLLVVAALVLLALSVVLSPLTVVLALLALIVAIFALIIRALRRRPLKRWGLVALASFLLVIVFSGVSAALYGGGAPQQASSPPEERKEEPASESTQEETAETKKAASELTTSESTTEASPVAEATEAEDPEEDKPDYDALVTVTRVIDGDTVEVSPAVDGETKVRLIGVDTPETKEPGCEVQPYGPEATAYTTSELEGEEVGLEFDKEKTDRYDRVLAYVYKDPDDMFNEDLVEEGYAQVATFPPNTRYVDRFKAAQEKARAAGLGIWSLSADQLAQLTDRDNGVGGDGCTKKAAAPPPPPPAPKPRPEPDIPPVPSSPDPGPSPVPAIPTPSNGADCSTGVKNVPVVPGSKGDRDKDGIACES